MGLTLLVGQGSAEADLTPLIEHLTITTVSPGGFGQLTARLQLPLSRARLARREFAILSGRVVAYDGRHCVFAGEVQQAPLVLDAQGEAIELVAQGGGASLGDDPLDTSYAGQTAQAIIANQLSLRSAYLAVDSDQAAILPTAPAATFSPVYDGKTLEDVLHDLCDLLGDYVWAVYDHPVHRDTLGFPTWQVQVHPRDVTTVGYQALLADVAAWRIAPSATRAFNGVTIRYLDPTNGPQTFTTYDARLNGDRSQGTAPFRFRRFRRDMGTRPLTATQAATIGNAYLASFQNLHH